MSSPIHSGFAMKRQRLTLHPLTPDEALAALLAVKPEPPKTKPAKRGKRPRRAKSSKKRAK
jgi:hypothetical protein